MKQKGLPPMTERQSAPFPWGVGSAAALGIAVTVEARRAAAKAMTLNCILTADETRVDFVVEMKAVLDWEEEAVGDRILIENERLVAWEGNWSVDDDCVVVENEGLVGGEIKGGRSRAFYIHSTSTIGLLLMENYLPSTMKAPTIRRRKIYRLR